MIMSVVNHLFICFTKAKKKDAKPKMLQVLTSHHGTDVSDFSVFFLLN